MKITQVEYRQLVSHGNFNNSTVGAVATVEAGEGPTDVLDTLRRWVRAHLEDETNVREDLSYKRQQVYEAENRLRQLGDSLQMMQRRYEEAQKILAVHGIALDVPADTFNIDEIPF